MHRVFVSFHHENDQDYKNSLVTWAKENNVFEDGSVDLGEIPEDWSDERIREYIRDEHLKDTTVTILLVGTETKWRKHVDWEVYSSMYDGTVNKKSGIIVILLPSARSSYFSCGHLNEKTAIYPENNNWITITDRAEYERRYPFLPDRIIDNLLKPEAKISVINWDKIDPNNLKLMIDNAYNDRANCQYDLSRPMRRRNG